MNGQERRQHDRVSVTLPARLDRLGRRTLSAAATTIDLSEGGVQVLAPAQFVVGDVVSISIGDGELALRQQGLVVGHHAQADELASVNIAFKTLDDADAARLRGLIDLR